MFGPVPLQEIECLRSDVALGVTTPDFVQDRALEQLKALRGQSSAASTMAAGFARKLSAAGLSQRYAASAATILAQMVMPALDSQIAELAKLRPAASHDAGVWRLPDGRSEEHTSELQSLMRISYAVFCLKKKQLRTN